ncbi:hypothetical protein ACFX2K_012890 [Malus domestica]
MRDKEKENNQPEAEDEPPILGCLLGSLTAYLLQVKLIHYLVHLRRLKIPPLDGGSVLPEKMPHLPMRKIRQVKTIPHLGT